MSSGLSSQLRKGRQRTHGKAPRRPHDGARQPSSVSGSAHDLEVGPSLVGARVAERLVLVSEWRDTMEGQGRLYHWLLQYLLMVILLQPAEQSGQGTGSDRSCMV